ETTIDTSSLDFGTQITINGSLDSNDISVAAGSYTDADDLATTLESQIQGLGGDFAEVTVTNDGGTLTISNPTTTAGTFSGFSIEDASGTQVTETQTTPVAIDGDGTAAATAGVDLTNLDLTSGVTGSFDLADGGTNGTETISFTLPAGGANDQTALIAAIQGELDSSTVANGEITVAASGDDIQFTDAASGETFTVTNLTLSDGGTANATAGSGITELAAAEEL
ncbi:hypothetical protein C9993_12120, partial [Marinobacter sp. Z-F4-2]